MPRRQCALSRLTPAVALAALLAACGGAPEGTPPTGTPGAAPAATPLTLMTMQLQPMFNDYMHALVASFEAAHPGTRLEWIDFPAEGYLNKVQALLLEGHPPDVINLTYDQGIRIAQEGVLADLRPLVAPGTLDAYFRGVLETSCMWEGQVYALPWYLTVYVTMYNKALMQQAGLDPTRPPRTDAECYAMGRVIAERVPGAFGFFEAVTEDGRLRDFLVRAGVPLVRRDADGRLRAAFNTPEGVAVLRQWAEMYRDGVIPRESITEDHRRAIELFKAGRTAFYTSGPQFIPRIVEDAPDIAAVMGVAPALLASIEVHRVDVMQLVVPDRGDTPEATERERRAAELAAFVTNAENQLAFCRIVTILPSVVEATRDPLFTVSDGTLEGDARVIAAAELASAEVYLEPYPGMGELNAAMNTAISKACLAIATPEEALAEAAAAWDAVFEAHDAAN